MEMDKGTIAFLKAIQYLKQNGYLTVVNGGGNDAVISRNWWYAKFHLYDEPSGTFTYTAGTMNVCLRALADIVEEYLQERSEKKFKDSDSSYSIGGVVMEETRS